jgi:hypothetical protein
MPIRMGFHTFHEPDFPPSQIRPCVAGFMTRSAAGAIEMMGVKERSFRPLPDLSLEGLVPRAPREGAQEKGVPWLRKISYL